MSDTPRTDRAYDMRTASYAAWKLADFARQLERELTKAWAKIDEMQERYMKDIAEPLAQALQIQSAEKQILLKEIEDHAKTKEQLEQAQKELAEYLLAKGAQTNWLCEQLAQAQAERDRLRAWETTLRRMAKTTGIELAASIRHADAALSETKE